MKIRRLNEDSKRFYVDEIVSAPGGKTETERHSFATIDELKQYCKDAGLTEDDIANCVGCDVEDLCEDAEKLHTKPNGEYLVKADSGKGYTAFSKDNVAIGGIDNEDADSDDKAIDKFKRNEYSECLNEKLSSSQALLIRTDFLVLVDVFGSISLESYAQILSTKYKYSIDEICGVIQDLYNNEFNKTSPETEHTEAPSFEPPENNTSDEKPSKSILKRLGINEAFFDTAEYRIQNYEEDIPELMAGMHDDYMEGKLDAARYAEVLKKVYDALIKEPYTELKIMGSSLKGVDEKDGYKLIESVDYDDDYSDEYDESLEECSGIKAHKVIMGEDIDDSIELDDVAGFEGPEGNKTEDVEFVMSQRTGGDFDAWKKDTVNNMSKNESFDMSYGPDLGKLSWQVASYLDVDALGEDKWIEFVCDDPRDTTAGKKSMRFEAIGEDAHMYGFIKTNGDAVDVQFRNGSEAVCHSAEEVARFIAGEFGISI